MPTPLPAGFGDAGQLLEEEDEATLAAIDRAVESADAGRLRPASEARDVLEQCRTAFSKRKSRSPSAPVRFEKSLLDHIDTPTVKPPFGSSVHAGH